MEQWHVDDPFAEPLRTLYDTNRVLAVTSGNAQNFASASNKQDGFLKSTPDHNGQHTSCSEQEYPIPKSTLPSNGYLSAVQRRLLARRTRKDSQHWYKRLLEDRPYLRHPKYITYRTRKRQDRGDDGKAVWPEHLERAFQNALVAIPPMGRKKKSQHGKGLGRNELISNWILEETGEERNRKQISSHIQTLSKIFKGSDVPEWHALVSVKEGDYDNEDDDGGLDFYNDSIADMVRSQRHYIDGEQTGDLPYHTHHGGYAIGMQTLKALCFSIWVSPPHDVNKSLHDYTRVQSQSSTAAPVTLEEIKNWQHSFPNLPQLLDDAHNSGKCDIILFKSSLKTMSDFPPKNSKLGINLELDFRTSSRDNLAAFEGLRYWTCMTTVYQHGKTIQRALRDCNSAELGLVRPPFESTWWAKELTRLMGMKKEAESNEDEAAVAAALELSRKFFRSLTITQEIYVSAHKIPGKSWTVSSQPKTRMAILLWTFAQAPDSNNVGTTSWQKVIPPNMDRSNDTSPTHGGTTSEPAPEGSILDLSTHEDQFRGDYGYYDPQRPEGSILYSQNDEPLYQPGYMPVPHYENDIGMVPMQFDHTNMDGYSQWANFGNYESFDYIPLPGATQTLASQDHSVLSDVLHNSVNATENPLYRANSQVGYSHSVPQEQLEPDIQEMTQDEEDEHEIRGPLATFDVNTHRMLQEQLEVDDRACEEQRLRQSVGDDSQQSTTNQFANLDLDDEAMKEALMAASIMGDLGSHRYTLPDEMASGDHPHPYTGSRPSRPPLLGHHSFAGVTHSMESLLDTPARNDFAHLVAHLEVRDGVESNRLLNEPAALFGEQQRPQSQPMPVIASADKIHNFEVDDSNCENTANDWIKITFEDCE